MSIEQIAHEVARGMYFEGIGRGTAEYPAEFLRRCLSKLAEQDVEPVAWRGKSGHLVYDKDALMPSTRHLATPLYTETQLLAAQQRTAEACAKVCSMEAWAVDAMDTIRNGDWRGYL